MIALRYLIPVALVVLVLLQIASAMHLFGWGDPPVHPPATPIGGPFAPRAPDTPSGR